MGMTFNADEVFEIAINAEENGAAFYRQAAEMFERKGKDASLLRDMANMEDTHKAAFEAMRKELGESDRTPVEFDPYMEAEMYLSAVASGNAIEGDQATADKFTGNESVGDVLRVAIGLEKDAVLFYLGIRDMVPEGLGKDKVNDIIAEEKDHIVQLSHALRDLK